MSNWISLDTVKLNEPSQTELNGVMVTIGLSPHDVPIAVRSRITNEGTTKKLIVEFKYIDDEPWRLESGGEGISVRIGKHSRRLYGLEMDSGLFPEQGHIKINLRIIAENAIDKAASGFLPKGKRTAPSENFRVAKAAIESVGDLLFQNS